MEHSKPKYQDDQKCGVLFKIIELYKNVSFLNFEEGLTVSPKRTMLLRYELPAFLNSRMVGLLVYFRK